MTKVIDQLFNDLCKMHKCWALFKSNPIGSKNSEKAIERLLMKKLIQKNVERVLVIPFEGFKKGKSEKVQFIFGYGDIIDSKLDLFILWDAIKKECICLPFNIDSKKINPLSKLTIEEIWIENGLSEKYEVKGGEYSKGIKNYCEIEKIKAYLKQGKGFWNGEILNLMISDKSLVRKKFLVQPPKSISNYRYANTLLYKFKDSAFILLKNVFNDDYYLKQGRKRSLKYDPYTQTREFLRFIGVLKVGQPGGKNKIKVSLDSQKAIVNELKKECVNAKIQEPDDARIRRVFFQRVLKDPSRNWIKKIKKMVSEELEELEVNKSTP